MRRILIIAIPILTAGLIAAWVVTRPTPGGDVLENISNTSNSVGRPTANTNAPAAPESAQTAVMTVSRLFAERYGSTSTANPAANLAAALPFVSTTLKTAFERTIANPPAPAAEPTTTVSRAFAFKVQYIDEGLGRAGVIVSLQRTERKGTEAPRAYTQDLALQLVRENTVWKVNLAIFSNV